MSSANLSLCSFLSFICLFRDLKMEKSYILILIYIMRIQCMTSCVTVPITNPWNMTFYSVPKWLMIEWVSEWMSEWMNGGLWLVSAPQPSLHLVCIPTGSAPQPSYIFYLKGFPGSLHFWVPTPLILLHIPCLRVSIFVYSPIISSPSFLPMSCLSFQFLFSCSSSLKLWALHLLSTDIMGCPPIYFYAHLYFS
jgi:hypothetical protein